MFSIFLHSIVFELCMMTKNKKKDEIKKVNKIEIFLLGFLTLLKVSRTCIE